jgi:DNA replication protein DnaC
MIDQATCMTCLRPERTDVECEDGWARKPNDTRVGRCLQRMEFDKDREIENRVAKFGLTDDRFLDEWDALEMSEESWRGAREAGANITELVEAGLNIVLYGAVGRGKTHAAVLICRDAARAGLIVAKASWPHVLSSIRESFGKNYNGPTERQQLEMLMRPNLILLDDVGSGGSDEGGSNFSRSRLELIITNRYEQKRPTMITTNSDPSTFDALLGERVNSRFRGSSLLLKFAGKPYRQEVERKSSSALVKKILRAARRTE